jgi:hypothetical protein
LWTDNGARAELNLGSAALRLNQHTNLSFINLDDRTAQIQISLGSLSVRVRRLAEDEVMEVDTPQAAFSLLRPGEYRIDVNEQGDTTIATVRGGEAEATGGGQAFTIHPRDQVRITGGVADGAQVAFDRRDAPPSDPFDNWCMDRDRREDRSASAKYVSRDMPGYADLDDHGSWRQTPEYGAVWVPAGVPGDWAPYHYGHWAWIAPWGWTWVDDAPWGYAPFHYGRWVFVGGGWGWVPGPVAVRPVYAPAMVAWVGGARFGVALSVGGPAVGWFPLGFGEVWVPAYHASPAYFSRVNVSNTVVTNVTVTNVYNTTVVNRTTVTNVRYVNQSVPGAVTAVPHEALVSGRPVAQASVRVSASAMSAAEVQHVAPVAPQRAAVLGGRAATSVAPPAVSMNRTVVTKVAPPAAPVPFARQQAALQANPGRPLDRTAVTTLRSSAPQTATPQYRPAIPTTPAAGRQMPQPRPAPQPNVAPQRPAGVPEQRQVQPERQAAPQVQTNVPAQQPRPAAQPGAVPENRSVAPQRPASVPEQRQVQPERQTNVPPQQPRPATQPSAAPENRTVAPQRPANVPEQRQVQPERRSPPPSGQRQEVKQDKPKPKRDEKQEKEKKQ